MCINALPRCVYVCHTHACRPQSSEEIDRSPGDTDGWSHHAGAENQT